MKFRFVCVVLGFALVGCTSAPKPAAKAPLAAKVAEAPADASPNTRRDRRTEPGVRAAAKPLVLEGAGSVKCGKLAKGSEEVDLLGGRLRVHAPTGWKVPPALADSPSIEEESRIVVETPKLSLAVVARETFQLDPDLYEADAPAKPGTLDAEAPKFLKATFPNDEALEVTPVEVGKMRGYVARPPHPNAPAGKDTALVLALLLAQEDGALESVGFYVRGETVRSATGSDLVGCTRLAERMASSIVMGPRKLEREAGTRKVLDLSNEESLTAVVPPDWVVVRGASAARLTKLRPLSLYQGSINVSLASDVPSAPEGAEKAADGKLLGHAVEWRGKTSPKGGFLFAAEPVGDKKAAVLVKATRQAKALDEMRKVAETLSIVKR